MPPLLQLDQATVLTADRHRLLDGLSLTIARGEHTALLGPNGSGKSTLTKLLDRRLWPVAHADGRPPVRLFGRDGWNLFELRRMLGIVTPDTDREFIEDPVAGLEAVVSAFFASRYLWRREPTDEQLALARAALARAGAAHLAERQLDAMSTGELRRVMIARALAPEPEALLLDEPTTGLDLVARGEFLATLRRLASGGATIVLVTHHVEELIPELDRVILLDRGRVAADGTKAEVLRDEVLSPVYGARVTVRESAGWYSAELTG